MERFQVVYPGDADGAYTRAQARVLEAEENPRLWNVVPEHLVFADGPSTAATFLEAKLAQVTAAINNGGNQQPPQEIQ